MQKTKKRSGLPDSLKMRHDNHYVDLISERAAGPRIRMIYANKIDPNPQQARSELGDINELMASIREKGILEPILVRRKGKRYEIIAGERRYIAAKKAGMEEIPCIEMNVEDNEAMELSLIENIQRKDLSAFEESDGIKSLVDIYGYNHIKISEKIGKARSTITEIIGISKIPKEIRQLCREKNITSKSTIIEIAKQKNKEDMIKLINEIKERDLKREETRELAKEIRNNVKKEKNFIYNYIPQSKEYKLRIEFKKEDVDRDEIIRILEEIIKKLRFKDI